jgi:formylglycine-generating enzyme required for sulfatase activity
MKRIYNLTASTFLSMCFLFIVGTSCKSEDPNNSKSLPTLTTSAITRITQNTATTGGSITSDNGLEVIARGVCWSLKSNPTIADSITKDAVGIGEFTSYMSNLIVDTTYYVRAYATNREGTAYGLQIDFKTLPAILPTLTTTTASSITESTASSGGLITYNGGSAVINRGVCWSTKTNPTIADSKTFDGLGVGLFSSTITGLLSNTTYFIRAYATTTAGTGYGDTYEFKTITVTNPLNIQTSFIPSGTFTMGSPLTEVNRYSDETQHSVTLSAFRMSKYEITNAQYAAFLNAKSIGSNGLYAAGAYPTQTLIYATSGSYDWGLHYSNLQWVPVAGYENAPVINVTWYGSTEFATYIGGTLPTEAQWEYACRAGTATPFNTGDFLTNLQANYYWAYPYNGGTNTVTTYPGKTQTVGTYAANAYGLYDMHGNVWEWCSDWYGTYPTTPQTNPTGAATGSYRVFRGGSWNYTAQSCRSAARYDYNPGDDYRSIGFRVVFVP